MTVKMNDLMRYRGIWLGMAMLWIMLAHSGLRLPSALFEYLKMFGYGGVDLCLFASGAGCYFSLDADPDGLRFLKRRVLRLAPAYLCFCTVWCGFCVCFQGMNGREVLGNLLGIQYLTGLPGGMNWYIGGLVVYYLLAPYLKSLADRAGSLRAQAVVICVMLLFTLPFWESDRFIILVTRIPVFYAGMLFARQCSLGKQIGRKGIVLFLLGTAAGFGLLFAALRFLPDVMWAHGWYWYPFLLITPGLCILISLAAMKLETGKPGRWLMKLPTLIGRNSFEVFLVHVPLFEACRYDGYFTKALTLLAPGRFTQIPENLLWLCLLPVVAAECFLLKAAERLVCSRSPRRKSQKSRSAP